LGYITRGVIRHHKMERMYDKLNNGYIIVHSQAENISRTSLVRVVRSHEHLCDYHTLCILKLPEISNS